MAISFMIGTLTSENLPSDQIQNQIEGLMKTSINKYYFIIIFVSIILLSTLFSIILIKFYMITKRREESDIDNQPNKNHVKMKNEEEEDQSEIDKKEEASDKINRESLVLYSDSVEQSSKIQRINKSYDSQELNSIMDKDEIMHGNSFRDYIEAVKDDRTIFNIKNDVSDIEIQNKDSNENILKKQCRPKFKGNFNDNSHEETSNNNNNNRQYLVLENDTRINTVNIVCHTLLKPEFDLKDEINENNEIEMQVKIINNKIDLNNNYDSRRDLEDFKRNKADKIGNKNKSQKNFPKNKLYHINKKIATSELNQIQIADCKFQNINFSMLLFVCMIQMFKVMIFNSFVFFLLSPITYNSLEMTDKHAGITLSLTCFISCISQMIFMKCFILNELRIKQKMILNLLISQISFILMILSYLIPTLISNYSIKVIFTCVTYIISSTAIENMQISYHFFIFKTVKAKSNTFELNTWLPYMFRLIISLKSSLLLSFYLLGENKICIFIIEGFMLVTAIISIYLINKI